MGCTCRAIAGWNQLHSLKWMDEDGWAHTFAAAAVQWSFCQAGFTGQQHIRLHCDNCIFIMKKKYKLNFVRKKKKTQIQKYSFQNMQKISTWLLAFWSSSLAPAYFCHRPTLMWPHNRPTLKQKPQKRNILSTLQDNKLVYDVHLLKL